jgi:hypothetical protein
MPDLDGATEVVVLGDSAGGIGVIANLDRITDTLKSTNLLCVGQPSCPLVVHGVIDAAVGPSFDRLDFSDSVHADVGAPTYADALILGEAQAAMRSAPITDQSCLTWHAQNAPDTAYQCSDVTHILRHHVTTPFFVRMALLDQLISKNYVDARFRDPVLDAPDETMSLSSFAVRTYLELKAFDTLASTAEEGSAFTKAPGVFAPLCTKHDTINDDTETYDTVITKQSGATYRLMDVFNAWRTNIVGEKNVLDGLQESSTCP